ncbi:MAG TPA: hypothetical protein VGD58_19605 [Herpetosiphonaceae bacterium]
MGDNAQQLQSSAARSHIAGAVVGCSKNALRRLGLWRAARNRMAAPAASN